MKALRRRIEVLCYEHGDFIMLAVLFVAFRRMSVLFFRPGGYIRDYSDFILYQGAAAVTDEGFWPFRDFWLEYPPLFPWLFTTLYRISLLIPQWTEEPRLWFYTLLSLVLVVFDGGLYAAWIIASLYVVVLGFSFFVRFRGGRWKSMRVIEEPVVSLPPTLPEITGAE